MIKFNEISICYGESCVVEKFSQTIKQGEKAVLSGPSGCGKSSILKSAVGFVPITSGSVEISGTEVNDTNISTIRNSVCYIPQKITFDPDETVEEFITFPFTFKSNVNLMPSKDEITRLICKFKLTPDIMSKKMIELSGGQAQRVGIARGLLLKRPVYLLDEITSNLDKLSMSAVLEVFSQMKDATVLSVSHDAEWSKVFEKVIMLGGD
jgi:putative ABC transport system ATP-binding protein